MALDPGGGGIGFGRSSSPFLPRRRPGSPLEPQAPGPGAASVPWSGAGAVNIPGAQASPGIDYSALLNFDPGLSQFGFDTAAGGIADASQRQEVVRKLLVAYGQTPSGFSDPYGDLDAATVASAGANPYSTVARIGKQTEQAKKDMEAALAARGVLSSGEYVFQGNQLKDAEGQTRYDAANEALERIGGANRSFAQGEQQRQRALAEEARQAAFRQQMLDLAAAGTSGEGPPGGGGGTAQLKAGFAHGPNMRPVYELNGAYYDENGNPIDQSQVIDMNMPTIQPSGPVPYNQAPAKPPITDAGYYRQFVR